MTIAHDPAVEPQTLAGDFSDLGRRIVQAARLAVAAHLYETARASAAAQAGRRLVIGGAGPVVAGDARQGEAAGE